VGGFGDVFEETGFFEAEIQGAECAGEELDDFEGGWGWQEEGVDAVDYAVGAELVGVSKE
jgi:hypothetical protein